jgi:hypothetical protein
VTLADEVGPALAALAGELARAEAAAAALDEAAGSLVAGGPATGLQDLDRLRQTLADLAAFAGALAGTARGAADLGHALAAVRSGEVAARLAGREVRTGGDELWEI